MLKLLRFLKKKDWIFIAFGVALVVLQVWLEITMPTYTQKLSAAVSAGTIEMSQVWKNGLLMLACAGGSMLAAIVCGFFVAEIAANFAKTLRLKLFDKITDFSNAEINKFSTPSLITRTTNDVVQMQMFVAMGLQLIIKAPVMAVWAICKISASNISWTLAVLITVVAIVFMLAMIVGLCYPKFKKIQKLTDDLNEITRENISGVRVIRAYNADDFQANKFEKVNKSVTKNHLFTARVMGFMTPVLTLCMSGLSLAIYWIAAVLLNKISGAAALEVVSQRAQLIGDMMAFSQYALQVVGSFMMLIMIFVILPRTLVSARRIAEVLDTVPSITYPQTDSQANSQFNSKTDSRINSQSDFQGNSQINPQAKSQAVPQSNPQTDNLQSSSNAQNALQNNLATLTKGQVEFRNVSFAYTGGKEDCLHDISFKINPGQTFAIIGATGSGKTTLINLISRFFDVTQGEILIDGENIKNLSKQTLQSKIALAPQKAALFKGDVKSNITYGAQEEISDADPRIARAIQIANADFVWQLEDGIHGQVAQGGTNFSGGQKQRLSIARAVFKNSEIIIFDDTFSALDYKTDMLVRKAVKENLSCTVIIVAQRIGTIKNADQILVLDKGHAVGLGKHEDLLENCALYKEIALSQLNKEEL